MDLLSSLWPSLLGVLLLIHVGFLLSYLFQRNDIADVLWGPGIATFVVIAFVTGEGTWPALLVTILVLIWATRLFLRILLKNLKKPEDARYARWRQEWSWFYLRSYLQVFLLQGALMCVVGLGAALFVLEATTITSFVYLGLFLWLFGFLFETIGDAQLDSFLKNPDNKGALMTKGLWKFSRHPNYFGEITMWWGIFVMTFGTELVLLGIVSPLVITTLICFVSGIPLLEEGLKKHPLFAEYKRKTSVLIPLPPKSE